MFEQVAYRYEVFARASGYGSVVGAEDGALAEDAVIERQPPCAASSNMPAMVTGFERLAMRKRVRTVVGVCRRVSVTPYAAV